ncbi:MAG: ATP-binding protein, partial [Planktomarina sp.]
DIMSIPNADDLCWYVAQNVVGKLNFVDCVIYLADEEQTQLTQVAALGEKNPFGRSIINPLKLSFGDGITGKVAQNRAPIIMDDLLTSHDYIADTQIARSEICVPMVFRNRVVGVIDSEHPAPKMFGERELEVLTTVAAMTSAKLELLAEAERSNQRYYDLMNSHAELTKEVSTRKSLETKLFEARKLEAVGRLAGGVAHDFNNLLTVISGNLELLEAEIGDDAPADLLDAAQTATKRGAQLVRNILAFSQKSRLNPTVTDLNNMVRTVRDWSRPLATSGIDLTLDLSDDLWPVNIDQNATENALLNMVVNAKDAIKDDGKIVIRTENTRLTERQIARLGAQLTPGRYVHCEIRDTGAGISAKDLQQIFDPFYTTKKVGQGSGLGLSMVLGFLQQSGGAVTVESAVGHGSAFHLFFPATIEKKLGHDRTTADQNPK